MQQIRTNTPNLITCLNLLSGCAAIIMAFHVSDVFYGLTGQQWFYICVGAAALFDFCDGFSARMLHAYSPVGKELDSLSDLISFGVAPGMLMFNIILANSASAPLAAIALLIPACGAFRLAKFNVDDSQATSFAGLPIPANALFWLGFVEWIAQHTFPPYWLVAIIVMLVSWLMVSHVRMFSLKFRTWGFADNLKRYAILIAAAGFIAIYGISGLGWTIVLYVLLSLFTKEKDA